MKKLVGALVLLFASQVLANSHHGWAYRGFGKWQNQSGESGRYRVAVKGQYDNHSLNIMQRYAAGEHRWHFGYQVLKGNHGHFKIMKDNVQIGRGHCSKSYHHHRGGKKCHYAYNYGGMKIKMKILVRGHRLYRAGTVKGHGKKITFKERLFKHRSHH